MICLLQIVLGLQIDKDVVSAAHQTDTHAQDLTCCSSCSRAWGQREVQKRVLMLRPHSCHWPLAISFSRISCKSVDCDEVDLDKLACLFTGLTGVRVTV